LSVRSLIYLED